ncbi:hypothetical protein N867_05660 [Actinotalea fermentans ATCC 43279 = JCM 9966 = DSM 3133]|uniref:NERD domain-containing protein n=2 Tax=Actinotalea fermentans TaxID=43671 RepID=A0A511YZB0_9CELL|nr:hypothetical protein N867_05660 [Actinotalea fermentans ATCC 43279 = JCM 9966 = DSM 3133]GEN80522.1 hypothetical protein AFE02nite_22560 [Actinotalea fermentans]
MRRAGSRARAKYRQLRRNWLRRKRTLWVVATLVLAVCWWALSALVFALTPPEGDGFATWTSGLVAGSFVALLIAARDTPPGSIERWQEGAYGEAATAKALDRLPRDWDVLHDLRNGDYNFDHVVVGPPGLFLLNSKSSIYQLRAIDGELKGVHPDDETLTMRLDPLIRQAKRDAVTLKKVIEARTGRAVWVQPVIVWWGRYDDGGRTIDGVAIVQGKELAKRITGLPEKRRTDLSDVVEILRPGRHRGGRQLTGGRNSDRSAGRA